jgi:hypothetical protein|tara:strand:- start:266 stop:445 length:180 start_codon:yes stop_codon:yes gene_type:complete
MNYEELKQTMIRLVNDDELSLSQLEYILDFIQGDREWVELATKNRLEGEEWEWGDFHTK